MLEHVVADLRAAAPELVASVERRLAVAATKAHRYVGEMHEIAATQEAAGLTPSLFEAIAEIYEALAETPLARSSPEDVPASPARGRPRGTPLGPFPPRDRRSRPGQAEA